MLKIADEEIVSKTVCVTPQLQVASITPPPDPQPNADESCTNLGPLRDPIPDPPSGSANPRLTVLHSGRRGFSSIEGEDRPWTRSRYPSHAIERALAPRPAQIRTMTSIRHAPR